MHRSSDLTAREVKDKYTVSWDNIAPLEEWLRTQPTEKWKEEWDQNGVLVVEKLLNHKEVAVYQDIYQKVLDGEIDTASHRHDLGNHEEKRQDAENICQVMWPSLFINDMFEGPMHTRALQVAKIIMGNDIEFDFDMLLSKAPHTSTPTPWHQDESYWLDMPDKRAASCWCAIDDADVENGCMWFSPGSHKKPLWSHRPVKPGVHVLMCDASEEVGKPYPLPAGSCTFHHGRMLHYSRGNTTDRQRRAYVTNFRPREMIEFERKNNYDHGKDMGTKEIIGTGQTHESN